MSNINGRSFLIVLSAVAVVYVSDASAQVTNAGILNNVTTQFHTQAASWAGVIQGYATWLFWTLGTISLVWTGGMLILKKADIGEFFAEFIRFCLFFGFFLWLLNNGTAIGSSIISSLIQVVRLPARRASLIHPALWILALIFLTK
jgi:type IV secretion system protein TrbL